MSLLCIIQMKKTLSYHFIILLEKVIDEEHLFLQAISHFDNLGHQI